MDDQNDEPSNRSRVVMRVYKTDEPPPSSATDKHHVYNGMDCCITLEVLQALLPQLDEISYPVYRNSFELQGPVLEINLRGVLVDRGVISTVRTQLETDAARVLENLNAIITEGLGLAPINPGSWQQVQRLLYDELGLPPVRQRGQVTSNRKALEKLRSYFHAETFINHILTYRDLTKQAGVLRTGIDRDGRMRTSFAIAGTDTGRFASYSSAFGTGTNMQNITPRLRRIFVADPGKKFAYIDLEQAESRAVGAICWNRFHTGTYLDFCESGDLHTNVARMTFKHLPWTESPKENKNVASAIFYRDFSYRESCKRLGHGSNYYGQPPNMSRETRIPVELVKSFQSEYFDAFPEIPLWHKWTRQKLITDGWVTSLMNRRRWFFGRRFDDETLKQAIAYDPQGSVADIISRGIMAIWRSGLPVQIMLQVHDALLIQYDEDKEDELLPQVQRLMEVEVPLLHNRSLIIPTEAATGWNWGYASESNPDGIGKYKGPDKRSRSATKSILDQQFFNLV